MKGEYDLVVYGATPAGIACAVRAARDGAEVVLLHHHRHVGGMLANGLGTFDTLYEGPRAPLFDELHRRLTEHCRVTYGDGSPEHEAAQWRSRRESSGRPQFAARDAETVLEAMVADEERIRLLREVVPVAVERAGRRILALWTAPYPNAGQGSDARRRGAATPGAVRHAAPSFVDASYEADLAACAGVSYRVGRESREEYGEPHAGRVFTTLKRAPGGVATYPHAAVSGALNLRAFFAITGELFAGSTGEGDRAIQAYNMRLSLTRDPARRVAPPRPDWYPRELFLALRDRWGFGGNRGSGAGRSTVGWNGPNLPQGGETYPDGDWEERHRVYARHRDFALGLLHFLQHDEEVPEPIRANAALVGLDGAAYTDHGHVPWEMYARETRRLLGRAVFTEHDGTLARGLERAPIHPDAVGFTEWPMDSHECHWETVPGSDREGKILLSEVTRPGQVPYRALLPREIDNLLVPVCLSASHVGWGTIRLEPTWMPLGEASAVACRLAAEDGHGLVAEVDVDRLQRRLLAQGTRISFFNDALEDARAPWFEAVQRLAVRGFFNSYDARPLEPLTEGVAAAWLRAIGYWLDSGEGGATSNPSQVARQVPPDSGDAVTAEWFAERAAGQIAARRIAVGHIAAGYGTESPPAAAHELLAAAAVPSAAGPLLRGQAARMIMAVLDRARDG